MRSAYCEIRSGADGWPHAAPLIGQVWPPQVVAELSWKDVHWAHADRRVLLWADDGRLACHVGLFARNGSWNGAPILLAGVGGVVTQADVRRQGFASCAMRHAAAAFRADGADCGLLFCEAHNVDFYAKLGWHPFHGKVLAQQPQGRVVFDCLQALVFDLKLAPRLGVLDVCGLPW